MAQESEVEVDIVRESDPRFVLVTGAGRSGTSTVAGSLHFLGLHLPFPVLGTNKSNPRGFYESKWAIDFHKKIFDRAMIDTFDARPWALDDIEKSLKPSDQAEVEGWLREQAAKAPQMVVKDPRSAWMPRLWADAAAAAGMPTGYVAMLRHPAEVVSSRATYYAKGDEVAVRRYQVMSIARWVNANLICERKTRGVGRCFVRYDALISDWRSTLEVVRKDLDLTFNADLTSSDRHPVDEFVDPSLRRHEVTWGEIDVPANLQEIAEETWVQLGVLSDNHGQDDDAHKRLDELSDVYAALFRDASAIANDDAVAAGKRSRRKAIRETRTKVESRLRDGAGDRAGPCRSPVLADTGDAGAGDRRQSQARRQESRPPLAILRSGRGLTCRCRRPRRTSSPGSPPCRPPRSREASWAAPRCC